MQIIDQQIEKFIANRTTTENNKEKDKPDSNNIAHKEEKIKKSFFDIYVEKIKEFLDNAE